MVVFGTVSKKCVGREQLVNDSACLVAKLRFATFTFFSVQFDKACSFSKIICSHLQCINAIKDCNADTVTKMT